MDLIKEHDAEPLRVLGRNPFEDITTKKRLRQLLQTHQGRDKVFKVVQYLMRIQLWWDSVTFQTNYLPNEKFTSNEKILMTILNSRRLFRLGRFFGEFERIRITLIKVSEIIYIPSTGGKLLPLFIQGQMLFDLLARSLMFVKCFCEDIAFLVQKGFIHYTIVGKLISIATKCGLVVLAIDLCLNTLRLSQGLIDASSHERVVDDIISKESFSLLSKYDRVDKHRRKVLSESNDKAKNAVDTICDPNEESKKSDDINYVVYVDSYPKLLWIDFELHWIFITEVKLFLDIFVALSGYNRLNNQGYVSIAGLFSGLCSVYRVWTYGR
ncbi:unnamed protein product [Phytomonas sp. Hart1]|nr:unnamed protein product [Phytomonas sp. Hart1]|eukprot:CCW69560.1 unnamed protein product [Phytomonas sp. isolate Hart1]